MDIPIPTVEININLNNSTKSDKSIKRSKIFQPKLETPKSKEKLSSRESIYANSTQEKRINAKKKILATLNAKCQIKKKSNIPVSAMKEKESNIRSPVILCHGPKNMNKSAPVLLIDQQSVPTTPLSSKLHHSTDNFKRRKSHRNRNYNTPSSLRLRSMYTEELNKNVPPTIVSNISTPTSQRTSENFDLQREQEIEPHVVTDISNTPNHSYLSNDSTSNETLINNLKEYVSKIVKTDLLLENSAKTSQKLVSCLNYLFFDLLVKFIIIL